MSKDVTNDPVTTTIDITTDQEKGRAYFPFFRTKTTLSNGKAGQFTTLSRINSGYNASTIGLDVSRLRQVAQLLLDTADAIDEVEKEGRRVEHNPVQEA